MPGAGVRREGALKSARRPTALPDLANYVSDAPDRGAGLASRARAQYALLHLLRALMQACPGPALRLASISIQTMTTPTAHVGGVGSRWERGGWTPRACGQRRTSRRPSSRQSLRRYRGDSVAAAQPQAAAAAVAAAAEPTAAAEGEPPVPHPSRLRLGADIPIALRSVTVAGCTFLLLVPDIDAGGCSALRCEQPKPPRLVHFLALTHGIAARPSMLAN